MEVVARNNKFWNILSISLISFMSSLGLSNVSLEATSLKSYGKNGCYKVARSNLKVDSFKSLPIAKDVIDSIVSSLKEGKLDSLHTYFHPNFRAKKSLSEKIHRKLRLFYGEDFDLYLSGVFFITSDKVETKKVNCLEESISLSTYYGYSDALGVFLTVNGKKELGKIYFQLVPSSSKNKWFVAGWHHQQWSYLGEDYTFWLKKAKNSLAPENLLQVYSYLDISQKLLFGGKLLEYQVRKEILSYRDEALGGSFDFSAKVKNIIQDNELVYAGTLMAEEAPGVFLRFKIPKEISTPDMKEKCKASFKKLLPYKVLSSSLGGIRCGFIFSHESEHKDGRLGTIFLKSKDISG